MVAPDSQSAMLRILERISAPATTARSERMVRFLVVYDRPQDPKEFDRHYREAHIPLTKKLPGLRRYTISRDPTPIRGGEPYYLIAELDWDDMGALERAFQSPDGRATAEDVANLAPDGGVRSMVYELEEVLN
jgi:uncharacterized protein (TIGR02118 family)